MVPHYSHLATVPHGLFSLYTIRSLRTAILACKVQRFQHTLVTYLLDFLPSRGLAEPAYMLTFGFACPHAPNHYAFLVAPRLPTRLTRIPPPHPPPPPSLRGFFHTIPYDLPDYHYLPREGHGLATAPCATIATPFWLPRAYVLPYPTPFPTCCYQRYPTVHVQRFLPTAVTCLPPPSPLRCLARHRHIQHLFPTAGRTLLPFHTPPVFPPGISYSGGCTGHLCLALTVSALRHGLTRDGARAGSAWFVDVALALFRGDDVRYCRFFGAFGSCARIFVPAHHLRGAPPLVTVTLPRRHWRPLHLPPVYQPCRYSLPGPPNGHFVDLRATYTSPRNRSVLLQTHLLLTRGPAGSPTTRDVYVLDVRYTHPRAPPAHLHAHTRRACLHHPVPPPSR